MPPKHPLDDHIIPPERMIIEFKNMLLDVMTGTKRHVRSGEQHIATCTCGSMVITSDDAEAAQFDRRHGRCTNGQPQAAAAEQAVEA